MKSLLAAFRDLTPERAKLIKALASAADYSEELADLIQVCCPDTAEYVRKMHSSPYNSHMWRVTVALDAINNILGTYGVEGLGDSGGRDGRAPPYEYLNAGDTYATTLIYKRSTDTLSIGNWGDIAERHPEWE